MRDFESEGPQDFQVEDILFALQAASVHLQFLRRITVYMCICTPAPFDLSTYNLPRLSLQHTCSIA